MKFFEDVSKEAMKNPRKAWKELNRLLGRGKRKKIEVVRTREGVITGIADESACIFHLLLEMCRGTVMSHTTRT